MLERPVPPYFVEQSCSTPTTPGSLRRAMAAVCSNMTGPSRSLRTTYSGTDIVIERRGSSALTEQANSAAGGRPSLKV